MKSLINLSDAYIHKGIMIITERKARKVAVKIKDNISININEVISLALLRIDESLDLFSK